jgi:hypothetical protein
MKGNLLKLSQNRGQRLFNKKCDQKAVLSNVFAITPSQPYRDEPIYTCVLGNEGV